MVPRRPSDWRSGSAATNQPNPWRASTRPSSRSASSALRTVTRLAAYAADSSDFAGQQPPGARTRPAATPPAQVVGDARGSGSVAHLSYTCMLVRRCKHPPPSGADRTDPEHRRRGIRHGRHRHHPDRAGRRRSTARSPSGWPSAAQRLGPAAHLRREDPGQPPRRPRGRRPRAGPQLHRPRPRPRRHAGRHRPDGAAAVHDRRPRPRSRVPSTVHCDHLIQAKVERQDRPAGRRSTPTPRSTTSSSRSRPSTASASGSPGSGIIHQVVLEQYAFPGGMMIGTDSHTPNAGGLGMVAIGVGGADAVDVMTGFPFNVRWPEAHRRAPHRRALRLVAPQGRHPQGGRDPHRQGRHRRHRRVLRPRRRLDLAAPARPPSATWAPRSAPPRRCSPTTTPWPATSRPPAARRSPTPANAVADDLRADDEVLRRPGRRTSTRSSRSTCRRCEPHINGPHTPDLARKVGELGADGRGRGLAAGDLLRAHRLVHQLVLRGHHPRRVHRPPGRRPRACGPRPSCSSPPAPSRCGPPSSATACWPTSRPSAPPCWPTPAARASASGRARHGPGDANTIVNSLQPQLPEAQRRLAPTRSPSSTSPETVVACALAGTLDFDPLPTRSPTTDGEQVSLDAAGRRGAARPRASTRARTPSSPRRQTGASVEVEVSPTSDRLQLLEPFAAVGRQRLRRPARSC